MAILRLEITGEPRNITAYGFISAIDNWLRVLNDLDSGISHQPQGSLDWFVSSLSMGSLAVEIESRSRLEEVNVGPEVAEAFLTGMEQIERAEASPPYLSEPGMRRLRQLVRLVGREGAAGFKVTHLQRTVEVSARASANIDQFMRIQQRSIGSVEGRLETISVHGRKPRFIVYHDITRKAITCRFEGMDWLERAKDALGSRVNVLGEVYYNIKGEPLRVEPQELRTLRRKEELPTTSELGGSDKELTGSLSTEEHLRRIRGG